LLMIFPGFFSFPVFPINSATPERLPTRRTQVPLVAALSSPSEGLLVFVRFVSYLRRSGESHLNLSFSRDPPFMEDASVVRGSVTSVLFEFSNLFFVLFSVPFFQARVAPLVFLVTEGVAFVLSACPAALCPRVLPPFSVFMSSSTLLFLDRPEPLLFP